MGLNITISNNIQRGFPGGGINASTFGFLPTATASDNTIALQAALESHYNEIIIDAGIYELDDTIYIPSNKTLRFRPGVTLKKTGDYGQVFINKGIIDDTRNTNIKIYGNGLRIMVNDVDSSGTPIPYICAQVAWCRVTSLFVDNIYCDDLGLSQYWMQFSGVYSAIINNVSITGNKDGFDIFSDCHDMIFNNCTASTRDDGIYIGTAGYNIYTKFVGDVYNITFNNFTDNVHAAHTTGRMCCIAAYKWLNYANGNTYQKGDIVTNAGRIYISEIASGTIVSSVAPTHTTGSVTGADGITWRYLQDGAITGTNIYNITFNNTVVNSTRTPFYFSNETNTTTTRVIYPNSLTGSLIDDFTINGLDINNTSPYLIHNFSSIDKLTFSNSTFTLPTSGVIFKQENNGINVISKINELIFDTITSDSQNTTGSILSMVGEQNIIRILNSNFTSKTSNNSNHFILPRPTLTLVDIQDTVFTNFPAIINDASTSVGVNAAINLSNVSFTGCKRFITCDSNTNASLYTVNSVGCSFNNFSEYIFVCANSQKSIVVTSTGSLTKPLNNGELSAGNYVNLDASDLLTGSNYIKNGTFDTVTTGWTPSHASLSIISGTCRVTSDGVAGGNAISQTLYNPGNKQFELRFRAKSATSTAKPRAYITPAYSFFTDVQVPNLTTEWQNYILRAPNTSLITGIMILLTTSLPNGEHFDIDDITLKVI